MTGLKEVQKHTSDPQMVVRSSGHHQSMAGMEPRERAREREREGEERRGEERRRGFAHSAGAPGAMVTLSKTSSLGREAEFVGRNVHHWERKGRSIQMKISMNGGTPIAGWYTLENPPKLSKMEYLEGYPHFRKPPNKRICKKINGEFQRDPTQRRSQRINLQKLTLPAEKRTNGVS